MAGQILSPEELSALAAQHGGLTGAKPGPAKKIPDPDFPGNSRLATEDPNPDIKYTFGDGTYLTAHFDPTVGKSGGWSVTEPGTALKPAKTSTAASKTYTDPDTGQVYVIDPASGTAKPVAGIPAGGQTPADQNADTAAQRAKDAAAAAARTADIAQQRADQLAQNQQATQARLAQNDTSRLGIEQQNANTSSQNSALQAARDQVDAEYKRIQDQVAQGTLSNSQAIERFKEVVDQFQAQRDALTTAMTAGDNAAKYAEMATKNAVGPQFGAHFAQGLQGVAQAKPGLVNYGPSDFTYPTPDYQGIAAKATAAALAHLSPFAAQLAAQHQANQGAVAAVPGYQPQPAQPDVIGQAAASVVGQQPGYRPAGS